MKQIDLYPNSEIQLKKSGETKKRHNLIFNKPERVNDL